MFYSTLALKFCYFTNNLRRQRCPKEKEILGALVLRALKLCSRFPQMYLMLQLNHFRRLFLIFKLEEDIESLCQSLFLGCTISILFNKILYLLCAMPMSLAIKNLGLWWVGSKVSIQIFWLTREHSKWICWKTQSRRDGGCWGMWY